MAFKESFNEIFGTVLVLSALLSTASAVDCQGKSFHCVNSTHFMICVDLGGGVSQSIDNFLIPCPTPTVCLGTNHFECEFRAPSTPVTTLNVISETTQPWEDVVVTTNSPQPKTTSEYSEKYVNTESLSLTDSYTTVEYTTEVPLTSASIDLNSINVTETVSALQESNVETTTTIDAITQPTFIYDSTTNLEHVPENIGSDAAEVITDIPQAIPENIATGVIEVTTETPHVDISTVETVKSSASDILQTITENFATGAIEVTTEILLVDTSTVETVISNASDITQRIPENIAAGASEITTEIPPVDISTVETVISEVSDIPQTIPEKIATDATEVMTETPFVDISTVESVISNGSDITQLIPDNIATGAIDITTEIPLIDISTVEAVISNASDILQTIPQNITTDAAEVITETPFLDISTISEIATKTTPSTISANDSVNVTSVPGNTININTTNATTNKVKDLVESTSNTLITDAIISTEPVETTTTGETYITKINSLANNQFGPTGDILQNGATLEQTTSVYLTFDMEKLNTNQPSTIPEDILTIDTTVNLVTKLPALSEQNPLNQLPTTSKTIFTNDSATTNSVATDNPTLATNKKDQARSDDRTTIVPKNDQAQSISTSEKFNFTPENTLPINKKPLLPEAGTDNLTADNIVSLQNKTQKETNKIVKNQDEIKSTTERGLLTENIETEEPKISIVDLSIGHNKTDMNILANTVFDTAIPQVEITTEKLIPTMSDNNSQAEENETTTEISLPSTANDQIQQATGDEALDTEKTTFINENNVVTVKSTQKATTQVPQDQEASTVKSGYVTSEQLNINTFDNAVTTDNSIYLPIDTSIITTSATFDAKLQPHLTHSTEQPMSVTLEENLETVATENFETEMPIFSASNQEVPQLIDEIIFVEKKPTFINTDNFAKDVRNNFTIEDSKVTVINDTQEPIIINPQDQVASTTETEYIKDGIVKVQPEIMVVTEDSTTNTDGLPSDQFTTVSHTQTGITIEDKLDVSISNTTPTKQEAIVTTDATTQETNQDKLSLPYDSETTMPTVVDITIIPKIIKSNSSNRGDTNTTYNPLEETKKPASSIFDVNNIQPDPNNELVKGKTSEGSAITNTSSDLTTTELDESIQNSLPLDNIISGTGSANHNEQERIGSNIKVKENALTNDGIKSEVNLETTTVDNQISKGIDVPPVDVQENTITSSGTTQNTNIVDRPSSVTLGTTQEDVKQIETVTIDNQNSQSTKIATFLPSTPVTDTNINSQGKENHDVSSDKLGINLGTDAVHYTSVTVDNFSTKVDSVTEQTDFSGNLGLATTNNDVINQQGQTTLESINKETLNVLQIDETSTNLNKIISDSQTNKINNLNQDFKLTNDASILVDSFSSDKSTTESYKGQINLSELDFTENNIINQKSQTTLKYIDKGTSNVINDYKTTTTRNDNGYDITYPQRIADTTSAADDEHLSTTATQTTKLVNNFTVNQDVSSSSVPVTNNEKKPTILENIQNALQAIGNLFNTASKNLTHAVGNSNNQTQTESHIQVSEIMTEVNIPTESEGVLGSTVFNNLQVSTASENVPKPDANIKWGSTESAPVNKDQNIEYENTNKPVAHIVPFGEANEHTNKPDNQIPANEVANTMTSKIPTKTSEIISKTKLGTVMEPTNLATLTTKITKILSRGTANDVTREGNLSSTHNSKLTEIEIITESYKPITSNLVTITSRTTSKPSTPKNHLAENIPLVDSKGPAISSTSENTITNGGRLDIGPVFVNINAKLHEKPIVEKAIASEGTAQTIRPIHMLIPRNSVTEVNSILQSTHITTGGNTQKDSSTTITTPGLLSGLGRDTKTSTDETNNSGIRNPVNVVAVNQQWDLIRKNIPVSTIEKEVQRPIHVTINSGLSAVDATSPQNNTQKITFTGTVQPENNSAAVLKNTTQYATKINVAVLTQNNKNGGTDYNPKNVQQTTSVNNTRPIKRQVKPTQMPVLTPISSITSTNQTIRRKTGQKPASTATENPNKQVVNHTQSHSCINGVRGRYSDKDDCRKFYICIGNIEPIIGHCPVNTVFSDIKKLCTKNMSHCIRENEFKCPSDGRYSDVLKDNVYYVCVSYNNHLYRFKFQCQMGYKLDKTKVQCVENKEIESNESVSISSDNVSESIGSTSSTSTGSSSSSSISSTSSSSGNSKKSSSSSNTSSDSESSSKSNKRKDKSGDKDDDDDDEVFECEKEGKFPVHNECRRYYLCKKKGKGQYRRKLKKCDSGDVFHKKKRKCVDADDYEC